MQDSLINQKIRGAAFLPVSSGRSKTFKYKLSLYISKKFDKKIQKIRKTANTALSIAKKALSVFKWRNILYGVSVWCAEVFIEGITANFATSQLLGLDFNPAMIIAHGIVIKQGIDIYHRLRKNNGEPSKLHA